MVSVGPGALDLDRFEELAAAARDQDAAAAAAALREALALWRGPALADVDAAVARPERRISTSDACPRSSSGSTPSSSSGYTRNCCRSWTASFERSPCASIAARS